MANSYFKGNAVYVSNTFSVSGVNTDPTTITLKVTSPSGGTTTYTYAAGEITRSAVGVYYKVLTSTILTESGRWWYQWTGTGTCEAVDEEYFEVRRSKF